MTSIINSKPELTKIKTQIMKLITENKLTITNNDKDNIDMVIRTLTKSNNDERALEFVFKLNILQKLDMDNDGEIIDYFLTSDDNEIIFDTEEEIKDYYQIIKQQEQEQEQEQEPSIPASKPTEIPPKPKPTVTPSIPAFNPTKIPSIPAFKPTEIPFIPAFKAKPTLPTSSTASTSSTPDIPAFKAKPASASSASSTSDIPAFKAKPASSTSSTPAFKAKETKTNLTSAPKASITSLSKGAVIMTDGGIEGYKTLTKKTSSKILMIDINLCKDKIYPIVFYLSAKSLEYNIVEYINLAIREVNRSKYNCVKVFNFEITDYTVSDRYIYVNISPYSKA